MFLRNSLWPGASMMTYGRRALLKKLWAVSMVTFWTRSSSRASVRNANSKGRPCLSQVARISR
jgi:hypothetical protein